MELAGAAQNAYFLTKNPLDLFGVTAVRLLFNNASFT